MSEIFMPDLSFEERLRLLETNADSVRDGSYFKRLSPEEVEARQQSYVEKDMELDDLEEKKKAFLVEIKSEQDPIKQDIKYLRKELRTGMREVLGKIFNIPDYPNKMMKQYNEFGELLGSRRLRPEEHQSNVFAISKTASL
jgi:hypothetical protein